MALFNLSFQCGFFIIESFTETLGRAKVIFNIADLTTYKTILCLTSLIVDIVVTALVCMQVHENAYLRDYVCVTAVQSLFLCPIVSLLCLMSLSCCSTCSHTVLVSPSTMELMMLKSATL